MLRKVESKIQYIPLLVSVHLWLATSGRNLCQSVHRETESEIWYFITWKNNKMSLLDWFSSFFMIAVLFSLIFPQIILIKERRQFKQISMSTIVTVRRQYAVNQITGAILQITRPLDRSAQLKLNFRISQPKCMLWVLKRTVSMRRFFWAPKKNDKTTG